MAIFVFFVTCNCSVDTGIAIKVKWNNQNFYNISKCYFQIMKILNWLLNERILYLTSKQEFEYRAYAVQTVFHLMMGPNF